MFQIKQSESTAARRRIPVLFVSSTDGFTPVTPTSPAAYISVNGATWVATTNAVAVATLAAGQSTAGVYYLELTAAEVANLGWITVNVQATNARQYNAHIQVMAFDPYDVVRIGLTSLPAVAQGNAGALLTSGTGVAQLNVTSGNITGSVASVTGNVGGSVASVTGSVASVTGNVGGNVVGSVASVTGNVGGNVTGSVGSLTATAVQNIWDDATSTLTTVGSVGKLIVDNLNATVSSRATDTSVWAAATRTLTAGTNIVLTKGTGITGFNDITSQSVWDVLASSVSLTNSIGLQLKTNVDVATSTRLSAVGYTVPLTTTGTAQAVWNALTATYVTNGSFGERVLRSSSTQATVGVTGSNHIAADIHNMQPAVLTASAIATNAIDSNALATSAVTEIQTGLASASMLGDVFSTTVKLDTTLAADGAVYQFTANALELAPAGGGGGGGTVVAVVNGPYNVVADSLGANDALDIQQSTAQSISLRCVDSNGDGVSLTGATLAVKVYNTAGTLVTTYSGTATYAPNGWLTFGLTTTVTDVVGTYTITVTRTTSATDVTIYGPLRLYVRGI